MNRHIWHRTFVANQKLRWPCPTCRTSQLTVAEGTLHSGETAQSVKDQERGYWESSWVEGRFSCLLKCKECGEVVAVAGRYTIDEWSEPEGSKIEYFERYEPHFFMPAPPLIHLPSNLPTDIEKELQKSFQLYWVDLAACANRIRSGVEVLLNHMGVKRTVISHHRRQPLTLHARILLFAAINKTLANELLAIKWIGNAGSHLSPLTPEDLLDGYQIMEHVFEEIFEQRSKKLEHLTRQINRHKKPRSAKLNTRGK